MKAIHRITLFLLHLLAPLDQARVLQNVHGEQVNAD